MKKDHDLKSHNDSFSHISLNKLALTLHDEQEKENEENKNLLSKTEKTITSLPDNIKSKDHDNDSITVKKIDRKLFLNIEVDINYLVIILVALSQGMQHLSELAIVYLYKDDFKLQPFQVTQITGIMTLPWIIKPIYGFISDSFPIFDYRRKPYLFIAGVLVTICWLLMCFYADTVTKAITILLICSTCTAFYNVIGEALVIELSQTQKATDPEAGAKNVSLYFLVKSSGSLISALFSGYLLSIMNKQYGKNILIFSFSNYSMFSALISNISYIID